MYCHPKNHDRLADIEQWPLETCLDFHEVLDAFEDAETEARNERPT